MSRSVARRTRPPLTLRSKQRFPRSSRIRGYVAHLAHVAARGDCPSLPPLRWPARRLPVSAERQRPSPIKADDARLHRSFAASRNEHNSLFEIGVVLDPVSELAQKWAPVIKALAAMPNVYARVFLAPSPHNAPASSIYSSSIRAVTEHGEAQEIVKPSVKFEGLPAEAVVSLSVDVDDWGMVRILGEEVKETKVTDLPSEVVYQFRQGATPDPVPAASDRVKDEL